MDHGMVPDFLPPLTQMEESVIARAHIHMQIKRYRGHQYKYSGHCVGFTQNVPKFSRALPTLPRDLCVFVLRPPDRLVGEERYANSHMILE